MAVRCGAKQAEGSLPRTAAGISCWNLKHSGQSNSIFYYHGLRLHILTQAVLLLKETYGVKNHCSKQRNKICFGVNTFLSSFARGHVISSSRVGDPVNEQLR